MMNTHSRLQLAKDDVLIGKVRLGCVGSVGVGKKMELDDWLSCVAVKIESRSRVLARGGAEKSLKTAQKGKTDPHTLHMRTVGSGNEVQQFRE